MERSNTKDFIKKATCLYGDLYSYEKVNYINSHIKVEIFCKKHNEYFSITPHAFLSGHGCPKCGIEKRSEKHQKTQEEFIKRCKEIFKEKKYDFSKTIYTKSAEYTTVICHEKDIFGNEHGEFRIKAYHLLNGHGCRKCLDDENRKRRAYTTEQFVEKGKERFGDNFDYSETLYINSKTPVKIKCKKCNKIMHITPYNFLKGCGCYYCNGPIMEQELNTTLVDNNIQYIYQYKAEWLGSLSLDFYLPDYNIAIECQGEQHFRPIKWWGGLESFQKLLERDERKYKLCKERNIKILYYTNSKYPPKEYIDKLYKNVDDILNEIKK